MKDDAKVQVYNDYLSKNGLKSTRQRDLIVREFFKKHQHMTVEVLWARVKALNPRIGYATVYRTLKLLTEAGLATKREFGGEQALFEHVMGHHHDHLICLSCNEIVEFENDQIESLQEMVGKRHKFTLVRHKLELYGYCEKCSKKAGAHTV